MKYIKTFESIVEYKPEYEDQIFDNIFHLVDHAQDYLSSMGFEVDEDMAPEDAIIELRKVNTDIAKELADEINKMLDLLAKFDVESEIEQSKLN